MHASCGVSRLVKTIEVKLIKQHSMKNSLKEVMKIKSWIFEAEAGG
jgi:hypothetical protein